MQTLKERIIAESKRLGIDKVGFTTAEPFDYFEESLIEQRSLGHTSGFEHQNIKEGPYPEETIQLLQELKETGTDSEVLSEIANVLERLG